MPSQDAPHFPVSVAGRCQGLLQESAATCLAHHLACFLRSRQLDAPESSTVHGSLQIHASILRGLPFFASFYSIVRDSKRLFREGDGMAECPACYFELEQEALDVFETDSQLHVCPDCGRSEATLERVRGAEKVTPFRLRGVEYCILRSPHVFHGETGLGFGEGNMYERILDCRGGG